MVVSTAFEIARRGGMGNATVKTIAEKLGCSVQPIYSYCRNMDGLRNDVAEKARAFVQEYIGKSIDKNDLFRSTGHAYILQRKNRIFSDCICFRREKVFLLLTTYIAPKLILLSRK